MSQVLEPAASGRSRCRGCSRPIARGELRFGERFPNAFGDGEASFWFHTRCAGYKRPEALLELIQRGDAAELPEREELEAIARRGVAHPRLARIDGAERARGGQAKCRQCSEPIARGSWRIRLVYHDEGRFSPGGFIHLNCHAAYFETAEGLDAVLHFSPDLSDDDRHELSELAGGSNGPAPPSA